MAIWVSKPRSGMDRIITVEGWPRDVRRPAHCTTDKRSHVTHIQGVSNRRNLQSDVASTDDEGLARRVAQREQVVTVGDRAA